MKKILCILFASSIILTACTRKSTVMAAVQAEQISAADPTQIATPESANECLNCHVDQQRLIDTAKPEEVAVKESSGTG